MLKIKIAFFVTIHVPANHILNRTNFSFTLEDLLQRLKAMKLHYPLCVYCHENDPCARLNYQQAMEGSFDGKDYLTLLFVAKDEIKSYKKRWPNQILVELPISTVPENWKDLYRQTIKVFCETLGVDYAFLLEDNIYCVLKQNDDGFNNVSLFEYLTALQNHADQAKPILVGSRIVKLGERPNKSNAQEWSNGFAQGCVLSKILNNDIWFTKTDTAGGKDNGIIDFNTRSAEKGHVLQNQHYALVCGYTLDDPIGEKKKPNFSSIDKIEPENTGLNLKVKVLSIEKVIDEKLSDGSRWARGLAVIGDTSACAVFIAINEQIETLEVGKTYNLLNAKVVMHKGWMRLEVDEWGAINLTHDDVNPNLKKNVSNIEYELVGSEEDDD